MFNQAFIGHFIGTIPDILLGAKHQDNDHMPSTLNELSGEIDVQIGGFSLYWRNGKDKDFTKYYEIAKSALWWQIEQDFLLKGIML